MKLKTARTQPPTYRFTLKRETCPFGVITRAAFSRDRTRIAVLCAGGTVGIHDGAAWHPVALPSWIGGRKVRNVALRDDGSIAIAGDGALAGSISIDGSSQQWQPRDRTGTSAMELTGVADYDMSGPVFAGTNGHRGVLGRVKEGALVLIPWSHPLSIACCNPKLDVAIGVGGMVVGIGDDSAHLVRPPGREPTVPLAGAIIGKSEVLFVDGTAWVHRCELSGREAQNASDRGVRSIVALDARSWDNAWAASAAGELLCLVGETWRRVPTPADAAFSPVALTVGTAHLRLIGADGAILDGYPE
jgi:hypothetical protein